MRVCSVIIKYKQKQCQCKKYILLTMVILCCFPILIKVINCPGKTTHLKNLGFHIIVNPNCFKGFVVMYLYSLFPNQHVMDSLRAVLCHSISVYSSMVGELKSYLIYSLKDCCRANDVKHITKEQNILKGYYNIFLKCFSEFYCTYHLHLKWYFQCCKHCSLPVCWFCWMPDTSFWTT